MKHSTLMAGLYVALLAAPAWAVEPDEKLADAALETRARAITQELRCVVCQNQSVDDSDAPLAHDIRVLVRERVASGDSDDAVRAFVVARYGNFVLLRPPFQSDTAVLWLAPVGFFAIGFWLLWRYVRAPRAGDPALLTDGERARLARLLEEQTP